MQVRSRSESSCLSARCGHGRLVGVHGDDQTSTQACLWDVVSCERLLYRSATTQGYRHELTLNSD